MNNPTVHVFFTPIKMKVYFKAHSMSMDANKEWALLVDMNDLNGLFDYKGLCFEIKSYAPQRLIYKSLWLGMIEDEEAIKPSVQNFLETLFNIESGWLQHSDQKIVPVVVYH